MLPRPPALRWECVCECVRSASSSRASSAARFSIIVSSSASSTYGSVISRTSRERGNSDGKNRWKKMVCKIPVLGVLRVSLCRHIFIGRQICGENAKVDAGYGDSASWTTADGWMDGRASDDDR